MSASSDPGALARRRIEALAALFPAWREAWIVHRDDDLVVVDKPPTMSTHAPDEGRRDDVVSRLEAFLPRENGAPAYLGIHQRLDRDTSGVLLFAKRKSANASLAKQFEGRTVKKRYVAVVEGKLALPRDGTLRHMIASDRDGRVVAKPAGGKRERGQLAVTRVRELRRVGARTLVEAQPETGRTHQIRAQLAAAGAPIVGDVLYGGAPAFRLMLHAQSLEIVHPGSGKPITLVAPVPRAIEDAVEGRSEALLDASAIAARMREAADERYGLFARGDTDAFRIVNGEGDGLTGVAVDVYGDHLLVHLSDPAAPEEAILDAAASLGARGVYVKRRPKHASRIVDARRDEFAPRGPVRGEPAGDDGALLVAEAGALFEVRLGDGLSTGIFLDQRESRRRVRDASRGARVLNLFAYTGSFSVAAALGGASRTVAVDTSRASSEWTRRNLARAGAGADAHIAIEADCFDYLEALRHRHEERFDLVVLDPPSFSTTRSSRFSADGGYVALAALALRALAPGGSLLACTNHQGIVMAKFRRFLHEAARAAGVELAQMKDLKPPEDFPPPPGREPHLKSVWVRLAR